MKIKYGIWIGVFILVMSIVVAQQATMLSLQGTVKDSTGNPVSSGNLRVTISTQNSCESGIIYDYTYNGLVQTGTFNILLGNDTYLNLTYNADYYLCTYINGQVQKNVGGSNTTKFRGGQGQIQPSNITNGTFSNGNFTFRDNLTFGAGFFIKSDEDFLYRVTRAPIKFKDLLDRTANENVTGDWTFTGAVNISNNESIIDGVPINDIGGGGWIFLKEVKVNITSEGGTVVIGNLSNSNVFKIVYFLKAASGTGDSKIYMRVNNISDANVYKIYEYTTTGFRDTTDNLVRIATYSTSTNPSRFYGSYILSIGVPTGGISIVNDGSTNFAPSVTYGPALHAYIAVNSESISDITIGVDTAAVTDTLEGELVIYKSKYFN